MADIDREPRPEGRWTWGWLLLALVLVALLLWWFWPETEPEVVAPPLDTTVVTETVPPADSLSLDPRVP